MIPIIQALPDSTNQIYGGLQAQFQLRNPANLLGLFLLHEPALVTYYRILKDPHLYRTYTYD